MVPRMNEVITAARSQGVMIIHAPSGVVDMYADTPYRKRMQQAPAAKALPAWSRISGVISIRRESRLCRLTRRRARATIRSSALR